MASIKSVTIDQKQSVHAETRKLGTNQYVQRQNQPNQGNNTNMNNQPGQQPQQRQNQGQLENQNAQMIPGNPQQQGGPGQQQPSPIYQQSPAQNQWTNQAGQPKFGNNQQWNQQHKQQNGSINLHVHDNQPKSVTITKQSVHDEMRQLGFKTSTKRPLTQTPFVRRIRTALDNME